MAVTEHRAGRYVRQAGGFRAFVPADLPPEPPVHMDAELWALLSSADRSLGRLDGSTETLPNPNLFVRTYVAREAVLSSKIEGTQASLDDVLEFQAKVRDAGPAGDVGEVVNYVAAMNYGLERLEALPISLRLIREIHERLMRGVRGGSSHPGAFRASQNWIGPQGSILSDASFVPPPPHEMTAALGALERFIHDPAPLPALVKVGLVHAQFETIHPFLDGNGRVGRLLITFMLCERGILKKPLLYLSHYFKRTRTEYYDRLQSVRDDGAWEAWLKYFLRGVAEVSEEATALARRIVNLREAHRALVGREFGRGAGRALELLETLYASPYVSVNSAKSALGVSFAAANAIIGKLEDIGILAEYTGNRRNRAFAYVEYLTLLRENVDGP